MDKNVNKTAQDAVKETVQKTETMMKDAQSAFQANYEKMAKSMEEVNEFGKKNMDAFMKSSEISAKAAEDFNNKVAEMGKANFDESLKAAQELASVKTVNELFEKQTAFAKTAFETFTNQAKAVTEMATKNVQDAYAPINERVEAAGDLAKAIQA